MNKHVIPAALTTLGAVAIGTFGATAAHAAPPTQATCSGTVCFVLAPGSVDSDGDGFSDADELAYGSDPFNPASTPTMGWMADRLEDGTLPSVFFEKDAMLVLIMPDGHGLTTDLAGAREAFGFAPRDTQSDLGITIAPAGFDLGALSDGFSVTRPDWGSSSSGGSIPGTRRPNDPSLFGYNAPVGETSSPSGSGGTIFTQTTFSNGTFTVNAQLNDANGFQKGVGTGSGKDPFEAAGQAAEAAAKDAGLSGDQAAAAGAAAQAEAEAAAARQKAAEEAAAKATGEAAAKAKAEAEAKAKAEAEAEAKAKADAEAKKKAEEEAASKYINPDSEGAGMFATDIAGVVADNDGSDHTNRADTPFEVAGPPSGNDLNPVILTDPNADTGGVSSSPSINAGGAQPETRDDLPAIDFNGPPTGGGCLC